MKYLTKIVFLCALAAILVGYYFKNTLNPSLGDFWVGTGTLVLFFIWMPFFIYLRWKDKKVSDYMLTKENLDKMKASQRELECTRK